LEIGSHFSLPGHGLNLTLHLVIRYNTLRETVLAYGREQQRFRMRRGELISYADAS